MSHNSKKKKKTLTLLSKPQREIGGGGHLPVSEHLLAKDNCEQRQHRQVAQGLDHGKTEPINNVQGQNTHDAALEGHRVQELQSTEREVFDVGSNQEQLLCDVGVGVGGVS